MQLDCTQLSLAQFGSREESMLHSNGPLILDGIYDDFGNETKIENGWDIGAADFKNHGFELFNNQEDEHFLNVDITIKGIRKEDGGIFLRLRIAYRNGHVRNIYFQFNIEANTALNVATEMIAELDITDYEVTKITDMIDWEICSLVPEWKPGPRIEDIPGNKTTNLCQNCGSIFFSYGSLLDDLSLKILDCNNLKSVHCIVCASMHGRFEEITYQAEGYEQSMTEGPPVLSASQSDGPESSSLASEGSHSDKEDLLVLVN